MVWLCLKVFWFTKNNSTVHGERRRDRQKKRWLDSIKEWTGIDFASSARAAVDRRKWKGGVVKLSVMSKIFNDLARLLDRLDWTEL